MNQRGPVFCLLAGLALALCASTTSAAPPNIVYILADDLGFGDVSWHDSVIKTPRIDKLAESGAKLEQFYVQPVCSPTRAALMTGRYPMRYGLQTGVIRPYADYGLPLDEQLLSVALKQAGYTTAICGKWHLGLHAPEFLPTHRGFEHQYGHYVGALDYFTHIRDGGFDWHRDDKVCRDEGYTTHLVAREAVKLIEAQPADKPLFLYVPFNAVHSPLQVPAEYTEPYTDLPQKRKLYAGMTAALDEAVGQILDALAEKKLADNTLVIFSSDNGGPTSLGATNGKLRAGKGTLYEGGVRVTACAAWPGKIPAGSVVNEPLHVVDWYPTLVKLAGAKVEQKHPLDGRDLWPTITEGKPSPHDAILMNTEPNRGAVRMGNWKLVLYAAGGKGKGKRKAGEQVELFDLSSDVSEKNNLADKHPDKVSELRARYDEFAKAAYPARNKPMAKDFKVPKVWGERD